MKESCSTRQTRSHQPHSPPASEPSTRSSQWRASSSTPCSSTQVPQPLGFAGAVPLVGGAAVRSALRKPRCGDSVAVPARGVDCGLHLIADTRYEVPVPELGTPGSVGAAGGRPPAATRPIAPRWTTLALDSAHRLRARSSPSEASLSPVWEDSVCAFQEMIARDFAIATQDSRKTI